MSREQVRAIFNVIMRGLGLAHRSAGQALRGARIRTNRLLARGRRILARSAQGWSHDWLHLLYNLIYPAILGTFLFYLLDPANGFTADPRDMDFSATMLAKVILLVAYCLDFLLAKKLYEQQRHSLGWALPWLLTDSIVLLSLVMGFHAVDDGPRGYFAWMAVFAAVVLVAYWATFRRAQASQRPRTLKWQQAIMAAVLLNAVACSTLFADGGTWTLLQRVGLGLCVVAIVAYHALVQHDPIYFGRPMSVGGSLLEPKHDGDSRSDPTAE